MPTLRTTEDAHRYAAAQIGLMRKQREALLGGCRNAHAFTFDERIKLATWAQFRREAVEEIGRLAQ